jgi:hypothetical protein
LRSQLTIAVDSFLSLGKYNADAEATMPRTRNGAGGTAGKKKSPAKKNAAPEPEPVPEPAVDEAVEDPVFDLDEDEVSELAARIDRTLTLKRWFSRDFNQSFPIVSWAWTDPNDHITYITNRIEIFGTNVADDITPRILENGNLIRIKVKHPNHGEAMNPEHLIVMNQKSDPGFDESHPQFANLKLAQLAMAGAHDDLEEDDCKIVEIKMPFPVDTKGFVNPFSDNEKKISVGTFPLHDRERYPFIPGNPHPSCKFLHLTVKELHEPKMKQKVEEESFF